MKDVVLVWGGWSCMAGYTDWAYVAEYQASDRINPEFPGCENIGTRLYEAPNREHITNPKNCKYGKPKALDPVVSCETWIEHKGYTLKKRVKMRTD
jgi:hypothetical protein